MGSTHNGELDFTAREQDTRGSTHWVLAQSSSYRHDEEISADPKCSQGKLNRHEYPNLSAVEGDIKRMINNAKSFNEKTSEIYSDAERIRKQLSNYMSKNNPAYRDPNYVSFPTPIPGEVSGEERRRSSSAAINKDSGPTGPSLKLRVSGSTSARLVKQQQSENGVPLTPPVVAADPKPYIGKTFQEAQDQIITELIKYKDDEYEPSSLTYAHTDRLEAGWRYSFPSSTFRRGP